MEKLEYFFHTDNAGSSVRVPCEAHGVGVIRGDDEQSVLHQALLRQNLHGLLHCQVQGNRLGESLLRLHKIIILELFNVREISMAFNCVVPKYHGERGRYAPPPPSGKIRPRLLSESGEGNRL